MKRFFPVCSLAASLVFATSVSLSAADEGRLLFSDDFERNETDESKEKPGKGWGTNSRTRAKGQKQVDLDGGAMHVTRAAVADHGVSVFQDVEFRDVTIRMRFKLRPQDDLGINIADMQEKSVHAGHICMARIRLDKVEISDLKTGRMKREHREARKAKQETSAMKKLVAKKSKYFDAKLTPNQWHQLDVRIDGDRMQVRVDDRLIGSFRSEGIAHPTKRRLRLAVNKSAWIDDVKIWGR